MTRHSQADDTYTTRTYDCDSDVPDPPPPQPPYLGMRINFSKTAAFVKNTGSAGWIESFQRVGFQVKQFVCHLMGIMVDQPFAPALTEALRRARILIRLHLKLDERIFMLRTWFRPVVA